MSRRQSPPSPPSRLSQDPERDNDATTAAAASPALMVAAAGGSQSPRRFARSRMAARRCLMALQAGWSIVGISLVLALTLEFVLRVFGGTGSSDQQQAARRLALETTDTKIAKRFGEELYAAETTGGVGWRPYVYWRSTPYQGELYNIDGVGLRRTVQPPPSGANGAEKRLRIFMFGGSTVHGQFARDEHTIPSRLAARLAADGISCEITNFGQLGYVSTQEVLALELELRQGNVPDLVVFYDGANDLTATLQNQVGGETINEHHRQAEFRALSTPQASRLLPALLKSSTVGAVFAPRRDLMQIDPAITQRRERALTETKPGRKRIKDRMRRDGGSPAQALVKIMIDDLNDETLRMYTGNMRIVHALRREYGFDVLWNWQPVVFLRAAPSDHEIELIRGSDWLRQLSQALYARVQAAADQSAADEGVNLLSEVYYLGTLFDVPEWSRKTAFVDFVHTSEAANDTIAAALFDNVRRCCRQRLQGSSAE